MMPAPRPWSWADVPRAARVDADCRLTVRLDDATYGQLLLMARAAGQSINQVAASILREVVADDAAAHAEGDR